MTPRRISRRRQRDPRRRRRPAGPGPPTRCSRSRSDGDGHDVELLVAPGRDVSRSERRVGADVRRSANVSVRPLAGARRRCGRRSSRRPRTCHDALRSDPPDVVVADDWRALAYAALRSRQVGTSLAETAFVVYCHGPARVFAAAARKVPDTVARFGEEVAQRACVELADAVVSPSEWLVDVAARARWPLPRARARDSEPVAVDGARGAGPRARRRARGSAASPSSASCARAKGVRVFLESLRPLDAAVARRGRGRSSSGTAGSWTRGARLRGELDGRRRSSRPPRDAARPNRRARRARPCRGRWR